MSVTTNILFQRASEALGVRVRDVTLRESVGEVDFDVSAESTLSGINRIAELLGAEDIEWVGRSEDDPRAYESWCSYTAKGVAVQDLRTRLFTAEKAERSPK